MVLGKISFVFCFLFSFNLLCHLIQNNIILSKIFEVIKEEKGRRWKIVEKMISNVFSVCQMTPNTTNEHSVESAVVIRQRNVMILKHDTYIFFLHWGVFFSVTDTK